MMPAARLIRVGVFVVGGLLIFALGLFMIGDRRFLFADLFTVNAEFTQVAGLQDGAAVRVNGMEAGEVTDIAIPQSPAGGFVVRMRLREELRPLVRADSVASIRTDGVISAATTSRSTQEPSKPRPSPTAGRSRAANRSTSPTSLTRGRKRSRTSTSRSPNCRLTSIGWSA